MNLSEHERARAEDYYNLVAPHLTADDGGRRHLSDVLKDLDLGGDNPSRARFTKSYVESLITEFLPVSAPVAPLDERKTSKSKKFEFFDASTDEHPDELGLAWADSAGVIHAMSLEDYLKRNYEPLDDKGRAEFKADIGFKSASEVFWPLPSNPCQLAKRDADGVMVNVPSVEEWEQLRGKTLLAALKDYYLARTNLPKDDYAILLSLWTIAAALRSPQMMFAPCVLLRAPFGYGKSTVAEAIQLVVPRCIYGATLTAASVYRVINEFGPSLVVDESALADNPDLNRVVKTGFKRGPKILRARQNKDRGVIAMDPWSFLVLTIQVDPRDDVMSRCLPIDLLPAEPKKQVRNDDPEARELRTVLTRLRLEHRAGTAYADFSQVAAQARAIAELEPRTKDKVETLWPIAVHYGVQDALEVTAWETERISSDQYAMTDQGLIASVLERIVDEVSMKSPDGKVTDEKPEEKVLAISLVLKNVHEQLQMVLVEEGEAEITAMGTRIDRKYSARDFTAKTLRTMGFKLKLVHGCTCIDLASFKELWPHVRRRYICAKSAPPKDERQKTIEESTKRASESLPPLHISTASQIQGSGERGRDSSTQSLPDVNLGRDGRGKDVQNVEESSSESVLSQETQIRPQGEQEGQDPIVEEAYRHAHDILQTHSARKMLPGLVVAQVRDEMQKGGHPLAEAQVAALRARLESSRDEPSGNGGNS